ncbi:hypothetical protein Lal_00018727 [Lupinus albus]|nr:hypothetical protein Lal_00018727 [Lupinus albus]
MAVCPILQDCYHILRNINSGVSLFKQVIYYLLVSLFEHKMKNFFLTSNLDEEKIKDTIWSCDGDKSPVPNGFNFTFLKHFWDCLKDDIIKMVEDFYSLAIETSYGPLYRIHPNGSIFGILAFLGSVSCLLSLKPFQHSFSFKELAEFSHKKHQGFIIHFRVRLIIIFLLLDL